MEILDQLSVALGFATLAGLNLYLTVLIAGLAIRFNWIALADQYEQLTVLGSPVVIAATSVFFLAEFFSDKIPWVDSAWDTAHTLIRPIGGALLAMKTLGTTEPAFEVVVALLAGGATLVTHGAKASTRLAINTSPEPVSNIAVSTAEDVAVVGGLTLMAVSPLAAGAVFVVFLSVALWLTPKLFRRVRVFAWLLYQKISAPADGEGTGPEEALLPRLSNDEELALRVAIAPREPDLGWTVPCLAGRTKGFAGITGDSFGTLIRENLSSGKLYFIGRRRWRKYHAEVPLAGLEIRHESRMLSEDIVLTGGEKKDKLHLTLRFPRGRRTIAKRVAEQMAALQVPAPGDPVVSPTRELAEASSAV